MTTPDTTDTLYMLYAKAAKRQDMNFHDYCTNIQNFNRAMPYSNVQYSMVQELHKCSHTWRKPIMIQKFSKWSRGYRQRHVVHLIQRDMPYFFKHKVKPDDDQPIVLITAPTGSAAFQIGGSTIHSAFLLHVNYKSKPAQEKRSKMQLKLEHTMLSITDEISMVGFKQFQSMNQTMCALKGTTDGNWGDICVLAVGDLYQLSPVGQCPIYMSPQTVHTLNDIAPNGGKKCSYMN